jgi:hypothetical protein
MSIDTRGRTCGKPIRAMAIARAAACSATASMSGPPASNEIMSCGSRGAAGRKLTTSSPSRTPRQARRLSSKVRRRAARFPLVTKERPAPSAQTAQQEAVDERLDGQGVCSIDAAVLAVAKGEGHMAVSDGIEPVVGGGEVPS